jgi:hypothetical protein
MRPSSTAVLAVTALVAALACMSGSWANPISENEPLDWIHVDIQSHTTESGETKIARGSFTIRSNNSTTDGSNLPAMNRTRRGIIYENGVPLVFEDKSTDPVPRRRPGEKVNYPEKFKLIIPAGKSDPPSAHVFYRGNKLVYRRNMITNVKEINAVNVEFTSASSEWDDESSREMSIVLNHGGIFIINKKKRN